MDFHNGTIVKSTEALRFIMGLDAILSVDARVVRVRSNGFGSTSERHGIFKKGFGNDQAFVQLLLSDILFAKFNLELFKIELQVLVFLLHVDVNCDVCLLAC